MLRCRDDSHAIARRVLREITIGNGLHSATLRRAEAGRTAVLEDTQDEGAVTAQLLRGVETAVGVRQEEVWLGVSACDATSVSRSRPTRWLYDSQSAALNVV